MITPIDPAAIEAKLSEIEQRQLIERGHPTQAVDAYLEWSIATCRALLAELARSRAAVDVAEAATRVAKCQKAKLELLKDREFSLDAHDAIQLAEWKASRDQDAALARYLAAKATEST